MFIPLHDKNPLRHVLKPYVTWSLIAVTCLVHVAVQSGAVLEGARAVSVSFGMIPSIVDGTERLPDDYALVPAEFTLVTYAFLHGEIWHLLGNMVFLWVFGDNVEDALGHVRFLAFYLLSAAFAALTHILTHPTSDVPLIGASGAVAACVAAYLMLHPHVKLWILALGRVPLLIPAWLALGAWILFQVYNVAAAMPDDDIAWWAHVGGLLAGAGLVIAMRRPGVPLFDRPGPR